MGFSSQTRLNAHLKHHEVNEFALRLPQVETNDCDDMERFLLDAVEANNLDVIRNSAAEVPKFADQLLKKAVQSASREMLESLLVACSSLQVAKLYVLPWAVEADNLEAAQILLDRGFSVRDTKDNLICMYNAMANRSPDMIEILLQYDPTATQESYRQRELVAMIPSESGPELEARVIKCLDLLRSRASNEWAFHDCFKCNAKRCCSIAIAKYLLKSGVDVDYTSKSNKPFSATALYMASGKKGQRAAELMKFLLQSGADPKRIPKGSKVPMSDRPGPANISKWLGISWEQLVDESQKGYPAYQQPEVFRESLVDVSQEGLLPIDREHLRHEFSITASANFH